MQHDMRPDRLDRRPCPRRAASWTSASAAAASLLLSAFAIRAPHRPPPRSPAAARASRRHRIGEDRRAQLRFIALRPVAGRIPAGAQHAWRLTAGSAPAFRPAISCEIASRLFDSPSLQGRTSGASSPDRPHAHALRPPPSPVLHGASGCDQAQSHALHRRRRPVGHVELLVDAPHIGIHRARRDFENIGDHRVALAARHPVEDLLLPARQLPVERDLVGEQRADPQMRRLRARTASASAPLWGTRPRRSGC